MASGLEYTKSIWIIMAIFLVGCTAREDSIGELTLANRIHSGEISLQAVVTDFIVPFEKLESIPGFHNLSDNGTLKPYKEQNIMGSKMESSIIISKDSICRIVNSYSDHWNGNYISISLNKDLKIIDAIFRENSHLDSGTDAVVTVENAILTLSKNPFHSQSDIHGRYTLLIKNDFTPNQKEKSEGMEPQVWFKTFEAKFKIFSQQDVEKGYSVVMKDQIKLIDEEMKRELAKATARIKK